MTNSYIAPTKTIRMDRYSADVIIRAAKIEGKSTGDFILQFIPLEELEARIKAVGELLPTITSNN